MNSPATHTTAPQTVAGGTGGANIQTLTGTGNTGNDPSNPPGPGYFWSGTAHHWVDSTGQHDGTGRLLTPAEQQHWHQYDQARATATAIRNSNSAPPAGPTSNGLDYDPDTKTWQYYDTKAKKWTPGGSISDIYNNVFNDDQRAAHPQFYYENQADDANYSSLRHDQYMYQTEQGYALQGSPTTRYTPTSF